MIKSRLIQNTFIAVRSEYTQLNLSPIELLIYSIIASYTEDGRACYETNKTLAERTGASVTTIQRTLRSLERKGYIVKEENEDYYLTSRFYFAKPVDEIMEEQGIEPKEFRQDRNNVEAIDREIDIAREELGYCTGII